MDIPLGDRLPSTTDVLVCRVIKSIYGLRQASREWNKKLSEFLLLLGFKQSFADYSFFTHQQDSFFILVEVYVDDILLIGNHDAFIVLVKAALHKKISIKDLGLEKYYLGLKIFRSDSVLVLS